MKILRSLFVAAALASAAHAADQVPLFNATLAIGKEHRFVLLSAAGKSSSFLRLGETFDGYTLKDYDAKTGELTLEKDGKATKIALMADAANPGAAATATPATLADAKALLDKMNFEQMLDRTLAGVRKQQQAMIGQMSGRMMGPNADPETREAVLAFQRKVMDEMMGSIKGADMKDDVAKVYSEVFTAEQLQALGEFYQSPVGLAFSDKQPELAEKMNAIMVPKIMAAMPRIQQMQQEFATEMRAKAQARKAAGGEAAPVPAAPPAKP